MMPRHEWIEVMRVYMRVWVWVWVCLSVSSVAQELTGEKMFNQLTLGYRTPDFVTLCEVDY
jgi:hypothetical protein